MTLRDDMQTTAWARELQERLRLLRSVVEGVSAEVAGGFRAPSLSKAWEALEVVESRMSESASPSIVLLGGTGAGKSSLINALIGEPVVPTSDTRACTSVVTNVEWWQGPGYRAVVQFVPRHAWDRQIFSVASDLRSARAQPHSGGSAAAPELDVHADERARLDAVYGQAAVRRFESTGDLTELSLPHDLAEAMDQGEVIIEELELGRFRSTVDRYLESRGSFWPLVESVRVLGPFEALRSGARLIDLPGLNDPNEAREATTRRFLSQAEFVWVVFSTVRSLTKEVTDTLSSRDLLTRLFADGRTGSVTFVGTHSDSIDATASPEEYGLGAGAGLKEVVRARNVRTRAIVREQLRDLASRLVVDSADAAIDSAGRQLVESPVFTVSARDAMLLRRPGLLPPVITDAEATEIPALQRHLHTVAMEAGPWAKSVRVFDAMESTIAQLRLVVHEAQTQHELSAAGASAQREQLLSEVVNAAERLRQQSESILSDLGRSLRAATDEFERAVSEGAEEAGRALDGVVRGWIGLHWATLRAASARQGRYCSAASGNIDFTSEIAAPVVKRALSPWMHVYGEALPTIIAAARRDLVSMTSQYRVSLDGSVTSLSDLEEVVGPLGRLAQDICAATETELASLKSTIDDDLARERRALHDLSERRLAAALAPTFAAAASECGEGTKERILSRLRSDILVTGQIEYSRVVQELIGLVRARASAMEAAIGLARMEIVRLVENTAAALADARTSGAQPMPVWLTSAPALISEVSSLVLDPLPRPPSIDRDGLLTGDHSMELDRVSLELHLSKDVIDAVDGEPLLVVDAADVMRVPGALPSVARLLDCLEQLERDLAGHTIVVVVDPNIVTQIRRGGSPDEVRSLDQLLQMEQVVQPPPGAVDVESFMVSTAEPFEGKVVSNASFREHVHSDPWLRGGRLVGHSYSDEHGWWFMPRAINRESRRAT